MKNKINEQTYCLTLLNTYRIHNIFHILFLKLYLHRINNLKAEIIMQASKLIDDTEQ